MADQVELITYADRLGGDLPGLYEVLHGPLAGLFGGLHVLPFFTPYDGADAGFDPADHTAVDPRLGSWADVARLGEDFDVMIDVIVNHVSSSSPQFLDWLAQGSESAYAGMFLTFAGAFPDGATEEVLMRLYRPRPGLPFTPYQLEDGTKRLVWTTFTASQVDVDVRHPVTHDYLIAVLDRLRDASVRRVRLDAVGYAVKTPGLTSFMTPDTFQFIEDMDDWCHERGLEVLVEVHSYYRQQIEIARQVDRVYDFALPPLILHALTAADADPLLAWMDIRPTNAVTVLDTHDGIGVIDVGADASATARAAALAGDEPGAGLLTPDQIDRLVEAIYTNSEDTSRQATGAAASNVDLYQVNCTFYDALGRDDERYLLARALQFFTPGIPQVYYVGLLAGGNDMDLLQRSRVGRDVNRHTYTPDEIAADVQRPVVQALFRLIRFRNAHPAFAGSASAAGAGSRLQLTWTAEDQRAELDADLATGHATVTWTGPDGTQSAALTDLP